MRWLLLVLLAVMPIPVLGKEKVNLRDVPPSVALRLILESKPNSTIMLSPEVLLDYTKKVLEEPKGIPTDQLAHVYYTRVEILLLTKQKEQAVATLKEAIAALPRADQFRSRLLAIEASDGDKKAYKDLQILAGHCLKSPLVWEHLAGAHYAQGEHALCASAASTAITNGSNKPEVYRFRLFSYLAMERFAECSADTDWYLLNNTILPKESLADVFFARTVALANLGRKEEALRSAAQGWRCAPNELKFVRLLWMTHALLDRLEMCLLYAKAAQEMGAGEYEPYDLELQTLLMLDRPGDLLKVADRIAERHPDNAVLHARRAKAYLALGKFGEAGQCAKRALTLGPKDPDALAVAAEVHASPKAEHLHDPVRSLALARDAVKQGGVFHFGATRALALALRANKQSAEAREVVTQALRRKILNERQRKELTALAIPDPDRGDDKGTPPR
jgi:tetratricopeptide (TPR) repeat protein